MKLKLLVILFFIIYLIGCNSWNQPKVKPESPDWPMENKNLARTSSYGKPAIPPLRLKWTFQTGDAIRGTAAVANGIVYFVSNDRNCYALDAITGKLIWKQTLELSPLARTNSVILDHGVLYVGMGYALNTTHGEILWHNNELYSEFPAFVIDSNAYYSMVQNNWIRVDTKTGKRLLTYAPCCPVTGTTIVGDSLITSGDIGEFEVWNINSQPDGQLKKEYDVHARKIQQYYCTFAASNMRYVYIPTLENTTSYGILAIDLTKPEDRPQGKGLYPIWETNVAYSTDPSFSNGIVYTGNDPVTALDAKTGGILWTTELPLNYSQQSTKYLINSTPAVSGNWVYVSTLNDRAVQCLFVLDAKTGKVIQHHQLSQPLKDISKYPYSSVMSHCSTPAVVDGWIYVGSVDSCMYAYQGTES